MPHPGDTGRPPQQRIYRPPQRRHRAHRHQGVHRGRALPRIRPRRVVKRPRPPHHHGHRQYQRNPLPVGELPRRHHRQHDHGRRQHRRGHQPPPQRARRVLPPGRIPGRWQNRAVTGRLHLGHQPPRIQPDRKIHPGPLGRVIDRGHHPVQLVQLPLHPRRTRRTRHTADRELDLLPGNRVRVVHIGRHLGSSFLASSVSRERRSAAGAWVVASAVGGSGGTDPLRCSCRILAIGSTLRRRAGTRPLRRRPGPGPRRSPCC